ncbi:hypothetical protein yaldo0001_7400 [Yersinia aldovae ATCC 35236]|nr:hypothetical protein yaldo0001_7400 [Yersinia aldovae ATCC 35236]
MAHVLPEGQQLTVSKKKEQTILHRISIGTGTVALLDNKDIA